MSSGQNWRQFENPQSAKNESKTIFVVRNPFDVVVSFHKWMTLFENNKNHPWYSGLF